jgi:hypothetical protein
MAAELAVAARAMAPDRAAATAWAGPVSRVAAEWTAAGLAVGSEMDSAVDPALSAGSPEAPVKRATVEQMGTAAMGTAAVTGMAVEVELATALRAHSPAVVARVAMVRLAETARVATEMAPAEMAMEPAARTAAVEEGMVMAVPAEPVAIVLQPVARGQAVTEMEMVLAATVMAVLAAP